MKTPEHRTKKIACANVHAAEPVSQQV